MTVWCIDSHTEDHRFEPVSFQRFVSCFGSLADSANRTTDSPPLIQNGFTKLQIQVQIAELTMEVQKSSQGLGVKVFKLI
ncbi:hypothetical protein L596_013313 [Steinernema carpocapsae]|uniref:Uncharacterized protein n=1 Tax=Steinernema carpocapsae TaxID=34508 RepID=A0A4U5P0G1_STECR|nr:hypothetical protein L596_013313 [Steinernema carpocapsae]